VKVRLAGRLLIAIGVVHAQVGAWRGRDPLLGMVRDGLVASAAGDVERELAFWFLFASPLLWLLGGWVCWADARGLPLPPWLGPAILGLAATGALLMPVSGFWLVLAPGALLANPARPPGPASP
jgi:hypothetical protein